MPITESRYQTPKLPSVKMRPKPPNLLRRQRPIVQLWFEMLRLHAQQLSGRWRPPVQIMPTCYNNHMGNICRTQRACPPEACGILMYPLQLLMGNMSLAALLAIFPQLSTTMGEIAPATPCPTVLGGTHAQMAMMCIWGGGHWTSYSCQRTYLSEAKRGKVPCGAQRKPPEGLSSGHWFSPGHQADVFWGTPPSFWPGGIPQSLQSLSADDHIYWPPRAQDLQNPRGLDWTERPQVYPSCNEEFSQGSSIFHLASPLESPKVMGLKGIHHPNALCHHTGLSYCPWCRKEGKNGGTVVNHLQTMHYKLGLVCSGCLHLPMTTSKAMWHHGQPCTHSDADEEDGKSSDDDASTSD